VLYETYTGGPPHEAAATLRARASRREAVQREGALPELDARVAGVIAHCIEPDPARRPRSALDVARGLPGGDLIKRAQDAGRTLDPGQRAVVGARQRAISPAAARLCGATLLLGLAAALTLGPHTRL